MSTPQTARTSFGEGGVRAPTSITEPGVYELDEAVYHADPVPWGSLSNSGAKLLLPPGCPALYRYWTDNPRPPKDEFDFGHAAHKTVLGVGPHIYGVNADDWRSKAAKDQRDHARAQGWVPLLVKDEDRVVAMADALLAHPFAGKLLDPDDAAVEQSLFWTDPDTDVMRRARLDLIRTLPDGRTVVVDYKSCVSAEPEACSKAMHSYGYNRQGAWYVDGAQALGLADEDAAFLLVFQEKNPPYLITVAGPDPVALRAGREDNRRALDRYAQCVSAGEWPGYVDDVISLPLPAWAERRFLEQETYA